MEITSVFRSCLESEQQTDIFTRSFDIRNDDFAELSLYFRWRREVREEERKIYFLPTPRIHVKRCGLVYTKCLEHWYEGRAPLKSTDCILLRGLNAGLGDDGVTVLQDEGHSVHHVASNIHVLDRPNNLPRDTYIIYIILFLKIMQTPPAVEEKQIETVSLSKSYHNCKFARLY